MQNEASFKLRDNIQRIKEGDCVYPRVILRFYAAQDITGEVILSVPASPDRPEPVFLPGKNDGFIILPSIP